MVSDGRAIQGLGLGCSLSGVAGSNLSGDINVCLLWMLCVVMQRNLRRAADHSSREVLLNCGVSEEEALTH